MFIKPPACAASMLILSWKRGSAEVFSSYSQLHPNLVVVERIVERVLLQDWWRDVVELDDVCLLSINSPA